MAARFIAAIMAFVALTLTGCSAIELHQRNATASAEADEIATAATENATLAALEAAQADSQATAQTLSQSATQAAATIAALESTPTTPSARPVDEASPPQPVPPASAETALYGAVPIDSDRLNIIAALAFDADGQLLVSTRAGEIYRLPDADGDGTADEARLIFADEEHQLGQVWGLIARGEALILLNGERLSLLRDADGDGIYETVSHLSQRLPADQNPLQASNGIVQAPDGRLFTADLNSGEILQILLRE